MLLQKLKCFSYGILLQLFVFVQLLIDLKHSSTLAQAINCNSGATTNVLLLGVLEKQRILVITQHRFQQKEDLCVYNLPPQALDTAHQRISLHDGVPITEKWRQFGREVKQRFTQSEVNVAVTVRDSLGDNILILCPSTSKGGSIAFNLPTSKSTRIKLSQGSKWISISAPSTTEDKLTFYRLFQNASYQSSNLERLTLDGAEVLSEVDRIRYAPTEYRGHWLCTTADDDWVVVKDVPDCNNPLTKQILAGFSDGTSFYLVGSSPAYVYIFAATALTTEMGKPVKLARVSVAHFLYLGRPSQGPSSAPGDNQTGSGQPNDEPSPAVTLPGDATEIRDIGISDATNLATVWITTVLIILALIGLGICALYCCSTMCSGGSKNKRQSSSGLKSGGKGRRSKSKSRSKLKQRKSSLKGGKSRTRKSSSKRMKSRKSKRASSLGRGKSSKLNKSSKKGSKKSNKSRRKSAGGPRTTRSR